LGFCVISNEKKSESAAEMVQGRGNAVVAGRLMLLLAVVAVALVQYAQGATTHDVGGADGWAAPGLSNSFNSSYLSDWASTQTFAPGDSLFFEYTPGLHDVLEVTEANYTACNTSNPIQTWSAGNTTVLLNNTGIIYFICGFPGHCLAGQKVAINVTSASSPSSTTPPPSPNGSTISSLPASAAAVVFGALFVACGSLFW
jgi:hypothetical protein